MAMSIGGIDSYSSIYYARQPETSRGQISGEASSKTGAETARQTDKTQRSDGTATSKNLSPEEQKEVEKLKKRDNEVRLHEQAHIAAGGQYVRGGPTYTMKSGPDGRQYASGGEVSIDRSPVPKDFDATIRKMQTIKMAALAPATPSAQDYSVAAAAGAEAAKAAREKMKNLLDKMGSSTAAPSTAKGASLDVRV